MAGQKFFLGKLAMEPCFFRGQETRRRPSSKGKSEPKADATKGKISRSKYKSRYENSDFKGTLLFESNLYYVLQ